MKSELRKELAKMSTVDFHELGMAMNMANLLRAAIKDYCKLYNSTMDRCKEDIAKKLEINVKKLDLWLTCAYEFKLSDMAKIQALYVGIQLDKDADEIAQRVLIKAEDV